MKRAFTLIELLVVIAIIAILAAILFPVFAQAKLAAKKATAISNAKQTVLGQILYINDYDDSYVFGAEWYAGNAALSYWQTTEYEAVFPYTKNTDISGSATSYINNKGTYGWTGCTEGSNQIGTFQTYNISLKPNGALIPTQASFVNGSNGPYAALSATAVSAPASTILMLDSPYATPGGYVGFDYTIHPTAGSLSLGTPSYVLTNANMYTSKACSSQWGGSYSAYTVKVTGLDIATAYSGQTVFAFADGHAKSMKYAAALYFPSDGVTDNLFGGASSLVPWMKNDATSASWRKYIDTTVIPNLNPDNR